MGFYEGYIQALSGTLNPSDLRGASLESMTDKGLHWVQCEFRGGQVLGFRCWQWSEWIVLSKPYVRVVSRPENSTLNP